MNNSIRINLKTTPDRSYKVELVQSFDRFSPLLKSLAGTKTRFCLITDSTVRKAHGNRLRTALIRDGFDVDIVDFPAGERSKNLTTVERILDAMLKKGFDRKSCVLALGGGVVGDMAGFIAGTYMRGIPFVQIPTSLLACVDSSVGGKTGVDLASGKNSCGLFNQPLAVLIHPGFLSSLPAKEMDNGLFEMVKHGVIRDADYFRKIRDGLDRLRDGDTKLLGRLIMGSCAIKAAVVSADEKEKGLRMILNFGHTVGHAVETASQYRIPHGRAVGIGMLAETRIGVRTGTTPPAVLAQLEDLMARMGVRIGALPSSKILLPLIRKDKKNTRSADMKEPEIPLILPVTLGRVKVRSFTPKEIGRHLD